MLGDASATLTTERDLVLGGVGDATRLTEQNKLPFAGPPLTPGGPATVGVIAGDGTGETWFSLWTAKTAISLFSDGGNVTPSTTSAEFNAETAAGVTLVNDPVTDYEIVYPPTFSVNAAGGSIYYGTASQNGTQTTLSVELAPSPTGQLELLAAGSIYADQGLLLGGGAPQAIDISGANTGTGNVPSPFDPAHTNNQSGGALVSNVDPNADTNPGSLFAFELDTPTTELHAGDTQPARIYAVNGDIVDLAFGEVWTAANGNGKAVLDLAAKAAWIIAGRDIVDLGSAPGQTILGVGGSTYAATSQGLILNANATDVSVVQAGRDIIYANTEIAGEGTLALQAGRNFYQGDQGVLQSIGALVNVNAQTRSAGATISVAAGVGADGPDWSAFAAAYLDPANQADPNTPLQAQPGKVVQSYASDLLPWLQGRGYAGSADGALAYFEALPPQVQGVFLLPIYFDELRLSGLEDTDPTSRFFKTYLRGNDAIAVLFPKTTATGKPISYTGDVTLFGNSGIHTSFGGDVNLLVPGGQTILGITTGPTPAATAGLLTQGSGGINIYSSGNVILGQSRIFTTDGGGITIWSADGDINAGRGAKTTQVFSPPSIIYDQFGDISLAPTTPTTGAGIATLAPIAGIPPGDVDLTAPLGTIDAGEAGIRASGNANLAALVISNAANIQVQGKTTGLPIIAIPNIGAATGAAAAAAQSMQPQSTNATQVPSIITVEVIGYGGGGNAQDQSTSSPVSQ